jgi:hypothetical protein
MMVWVPLLACPAVFSVLALLGKPAVAPTGKSVITFENSYRKPIALALNRYEHLTKTEGPDRNRHADRAKA